MAFSTTSFPLPLLFTFDERAGLEGTGVCSFKEGFTGEIDKVSVRLL